MSEQESVGLREAKKEQRRNALARAAGRLATEGGIQAVTANAVAELAGVSPRTFHNYFPVREQAIAHCIELVVDEWAEMFSNDRTSRSSVDVLVAGIRAIDAQGPVFSNVYDQLIMLGNLGAGDVREFEVRIRDRFALALAHRDGRDAPNHDDHVIVQCIFSAVQNASIAAHRHIDPVSAFTPYLKAWLNATRTFLGAELMQVPPELAEELDLEYSKPV